jgi:hypothetical protein
MSASQPTGAVFVDPEAGGWICAWCASVRGLGSSAPGESPVSTARQPLSTVAFTRHRFYRTGQVGGAVSPRYYRAHRRQFLCRTALLEES